ncbi:MAG TPA: conjugative coupling factor TraD, PFGI-1 class, partial [Polyangiaceae bacterium]|nr:conjugative coupling factor TraD, PFGI-1 class [Polyangiaceae bacterium]
MKHPVEALLRPPVELWSAASAAACASVCLAAPSALFMTPGVAWSAAAIFAALAWTRARQGVRVLRYQRRLRFLPRYRLAADRIPWSPTRLFLGRGFRWTQIHAQRLRDTLRPAARRYLEPSRLEAWARRHEPAWERGSATRWIARLTRADAWWNPLRPPPPVGGLSQIHGVETDEQDVWLPLEERNGHTLVLG